MCEGRGRVGGNMQIEGILMPNLLALFCYHKAFLFDIRDKKVLFDHKYDILKVSC